MKLMSVDVLKKRMQQKRNKTALRSRQLESKLTLELRSKLVKYLEKNECVLLEVDEDVLGEFLNILSATFLTVYTVEQVDKNKFVFSHREIVF